MGVNVLSGKSGTVDGSATVRDWSVDAEDLLAKYHASGGSEGQGALAGNTDWTGSYNAYGSLAARLPGASFTFIGTVDGVRGVEGVAMVSQNVITFDIEAGTVISHVVSFEGNGLLTRSDSVTGQPIADAVIPDPPSAKGVLLKQAEVIDVPVFTNIADVRVITLTLTRNNPSFVSSDTAGGTQRVSGNFSAELSYTIYESDMALLPTEGDVQQFKIQIDSVAKNNYDLRWFRFENASGIEVPIESADPVGCTLNWTMSGFESPTPTGTRLKGAMLGPDPADVTQPVIW
jgi:hypothetical protein